MTHEHCGNEHQDDTASTHAWAKCKSGARLYSLERHLAVYRFFADKPFWPTAAFTSSLNASVSTFSLRGCRSTSRWSAAFMMTAGERRVALTPSGPISLWRPVFW